MTPFQAVLSWGRQHSATNAESIRAFRAAYPDVDIKPMVHDWWKRGFLTDRDAQSFGVFTETGRRR